MVVKWIQFVVGKNINSLSKCVLSNYEPSHGLHGQQRSKCPHDERRRFMYGILFRGISLVSNNRFLTIVRLPRDLRVSIARFWRVWAVVEFTKFNTCNRFPVAGAQTRKPYNFSRANLKESFSPEDNRSIIHTKKAIVLSTSQILPQDSIFGKKHYREGLIDHTQYSNIVHSL